ncbi:cell division protein ZipA [Shewanella sp. NIFS-20-20]|uniref:cell division protein ZipA n=1 Tax=Shewanella sp. NIFS-20-20 TaxID=2853806 RepID=UPI001C4590F0|nr:cell division protein ZipA [Shewanella sp. NIFS-20-20]MBV7315541.1 cell division protein ZipA [Shewanella sp. NIFS-20-20]
MENFQLVVAVLGAIAIIAVLVHGLWSIRKQRPRPLRDSPTAKVYKDNAEASPRVDRDGFDADGIGAVRVRKSVAADTSAESTAEISSLRMTAAADPAPLAAVQDEPAAFALSPEPGAKVTRERREPSMGASTLDDSALASADEVQMELGLTTQAAAQSQVNAPQAPEAVASAEAEEAPLGEPTDVLVLHVVAKEGQVLQGAELLPCLLTLNFKYGDMNIFHRHVDNAGNGKVLFSLANMLKPGIFDPDNMEQFSTHGVVLFMTLPCHGDALINFSIMLNSAQQLADDLGADVLDGSRHPWSDLTKQAYIQRIRQQL